MDLAFQFLETIFSLFKKYNSPHPLEQISLTCQLAFVKSNLGYFGSS
jgi:hypothetical protein